MNVYMYITTELYMFPIHGSLIHWGELARGHLPVDRHWTKTDTSEFVSMLLNAVEILVMRDFCLCEIGLCKMWFQDGFWWKPAVSMPLACYSHFKMYSMASKTYACSITNKNFKKNFYGSVAVTKVKFLQCKMWKLTEW